MSKSGAEGGRIESVVRTQIGGRLREFSVEQVGNELVLHGKARSYHVKQLAQHAVMTLTDQPILANQIEVVSA
jgi:hypothetical protein